MITPLTPTRILVADDSRSVRDSVVAALSELSDVHVTPVENGAQALKEACSGNYALLVCDIEMPVMNGIQVLRVLRQQFYSPTELPIIMLTQVGDTEHKARAFADGANDYVTKPVESQELIARAKAQIQLRQLYRENLANQAFNLHAQKLAAVAQLSATLAHELNTPAQYLSDNLSFLSEAFDELLGGVDAAQSPRWPDALEYLKKEIPSSLNDMREGVFKIASIVSTIAEFAEADSQRVTNIDLARTIDNVVELLRSRWLGVVELSTHHSSQVHNVHCGPVDLKHALWQLIAQAVDEASTHGEGRGRVDIATRRDEGAVTISVRASRPARKHPDTVPPPNTDALKLTRAVLHRQHAELTRHVDQDSATSVIKLPA